MPSNQEAKKAQRAKASCAVCKGKADHHIDGRDVCSSCFVDQLIEAVGVLDHCAGDERERLKERYKRILCDAVDKAIEEK